MTPEEIEIAKSLLIEVKNISGQGYDVLVQGTMVSGMLNAMVLLVSVVVAFLSSYKMYKSVALYREIDSSRLRASFVTFVLAGLLTVIVASILNSILMSVFAPDYVILNKIIETATGC